MEFIAMTDCIFCQIVNGGLPSYKVYEDENVLAFLDIHPVTKGHTLVIPKKHHVDFTSTPPDELADVMAIAQELAPGVAEAVGVSSYNISVNNGAAAGQAVFHFHVHIIPRREEDNLSKWPRGDYSDGEAELFLKKIKAKII